MTFSVWNFEICQQQHSFTSSIFFAKMAKITESAISERSSEGYNQIVPLRTIKPWKILIKKNKVIWHPFSKRWPRWWWWCGWKNPPKAKVKNRRKIKKVAHVARYTGCLILVRNQIIFFLYVLHDGSALIFKHLL